MEEEEKKKKKKKEKKKETKEKKTGFVRPLFQLKFDGFLQLGSG